MPQHHIAQVNIARARVSLDDPIMRDFVAFLPHVNALADAAPGFVWRYQSDAGDATSLRVYDDDLIIVNFSVWESIEALKNFAYKGDHSYVMRKRRKWFEQMDEQYMAMWWIPAGHIPTWEEAQDRLDHLRKHGETPYAFSFRTIFAPQDANP